MKTIHKYEIYLGFGFSILMLQGAEILTFQNQNETPQIWALVDISQPMESRRFATYGTGHQIDKDYESRLKYIGSVQLQTGNFVFHLFEILS